MADDVKDTTKAAETGTTADTKPGTSETQDRSDARYTDLIDKLKAKDREIEAALSEKKSAADRAAKLEFDLKFSELEKQYPYAKDHRAEIEDRVKKGMTPDEATVLVLGMQKKLVGADELKRTADATASVGGSADTSIAGAEKKAAKDMSQEEVLKALKELESKGDLSLM